MGRFRINFYLSEAGYRTGVTAYVLDLGKAPRAHAVAMAKACMKDSSFYCYELEEY